MIKRKFPAPRIEQIPFQAIQKESFLAVWFLSYCLLVSEAERFIIRSVGISGKNIEDPGLKKNLNACLYQETQHAESHQRFNEAFFKGRPAMRSFVVMANLINYRLIEPLASSSFRLSVASAMEQLNAEISYYGIQNIDLITSDPIFRDLLTWHFVEEIEHRDCLYDLMRVKEVSGALKTLGMVLALASYCMWITGGALLISMKSLRFRKIQAVGTVLLRLLNSAMRYLRASYHPSQEVMPPSFNQELARLV